MKKIAVVFSILIYSLCNAQNGSGGLKITYLENDSAGVVGIKDRKKDTINVVMLVCDTTDREFRAVEWTLGYSVREQHSTSEGVFDPGFSQCLDDNGNPTSCYHDYWVHIKFLNQKKEPLSKSLIVWDSKPCSVKQ